MTQRLLLSVFLMVFLAGCATGPRGPRQSGPQDSILTDMCSKYAMNCALDPVDQAVTMLYKARQIKVMVGSSVVMAAGKEITLSGPVKRLKGVVMVPPDFEDRVIIQLVAETAAAAGGRIKPAGKVVIDPGHGGNDPGAIGVGGVKEKNIVLDLSRRIRDGLVKAGVDVVMTRDKDEYPTLEKRTEIASVAGVELFVSIHVNSVQQDRKGHRNPGAQGIEVYYSGPLSAKDAGDRQRQENEGALIASFAMDHGSRDLKKIVLDMLYVNKLVVSPRLATQVAAGISHGVVGSRGRGCKQARFAVLRNTLVPAILVEVGFLTNPREARLLKDDNYLQKMAEAIVDSIVGYLYDPK